MGYIANDPGVLSITTGSMTQLVPVTKGLNSAYLIVPGGTQYGWDRFLSA